MEAPNNPEDVSRQFFELCGDLELGELVTTPNFQLAEVMSAIELMEPKMDVGVMSDNIKTMSDAVKMGLYGDDMPLQLAVMDATIAMLVAWLEGSSLGSTVWTNIMCRNIKEVVHPVFRPFILGVNLLVRNIHSLVSNVGNIEELPEDFNVQPIFTEMELESRQEVTALMRNQIVHLGEQAKIWKTKTKSVRAEQICHAVGNRLEFVVLLLELLGLLVAPEIEDPNYVHKIHLGHTVINEKEYDAFWQGNGEAAGTTTEPGTSVAAEKKCVTVRKVEKKKGKGKKGKQAKKSEVIDKNVMDVIESVHQEKVQQEKKQGNQKKGNKKCQKAAENSEKSKESCSSGDLTEDNVDEEEIEDEEYDYEEIVQFTPNFQYASVLAMRLERVVVLIKETMILGRRAPDDVEHDFSWLMPFEPKACISLIPACFPRTVKVPTRQAAADWWIECSRRISDICNVTPNSTKNINTLFYFAQSFNVGSCVFTRSLLQVAMFPMDNHLMGKSTTAADIIESSLKSSFMPQVLEKDRFSSPVNEDPEARALYVAFLNQMTKLAITTYSSFGCNLTRQRDRLEIAIEELATLQYHAGRLENRTDEVMVAAKSVDVHTQNVSFHSVATFVFHNLLAICHYYFELGFRMDLYVPYEYPYIFWYLGDIDAKWMITTMERSHEIQLSYWKTCSLSTTVNPRRQKEKLRHEEELKRRCAVQQFAVVNQYAISQICEGIVKVSVALIRQEKVFMPHGGEAAERLRFERRFEFLQNLGPPLNVNYDQYKHKSGVDQLYEIEVKDLIAMAVENFNNAKQGLEKLDNTIEQNRDHFQLLRVAKSNMVACNLLKAGVSDDRNVEWAWFEDFPIYPYLKFGIAAK